MIGQIGSGESLLRYWDNNTRKYIEDIIRWREDIEITSWKTRAYGIFTRVGEVSEIERVSTANE